jgi:hypothetical protein
VKLLFGRARRATAKPPHVVEVKEFAGATLPEAVLENKATNCVIPVVLPLT